MKKFALLATLVVVGFAALPASATIKSYQVTGTVFQMEPGKLTILKSDGDKWEVGQGTVAIPAGVTLGSKVTVEYTMTADTITLKDKPAAAAGAAAPAAAPAAAKTKKAKAVAPAAAPAQ